MRKSGKKKNKTQKYVGKGRKRGRNSKPPKLMYDETMMIRAKTKFELLMSGAAYPTKSDLNKVLKTVCLDCCYKEDYEKFREALKRRLGDYYKPYTSSKGCTGNIRGSLPKLSQEEELQIVNWIRDMAI